MTKSIKLFIISAITVLFVANVNAQTATFEEITHDFGTASENAGTLEYEFVLTNTGDKPLVIQRVQTSCGCTTSGWTKEPILPKGKGTVNAVYHTKGRPGPFSKNLTVYTNGDPASVVLYIVGTVTAAPVDLRTIYRDSIGDLRVKNLRNMDFPTIPSTKTTQIQIIEVANAQTSDVSISFENVPEYINIVAEPKNLIPKQKGMIKVSIDGNKRKKFGYAKDGIEIKVGNARKVIEIKSIVSEDLSVSAKDPKMIIADSFVQLTGNNNGLLEIKNEGSNDLVINSIASDNPNVSIAFVRSLKIKPGKAVKVKISANTPGNNTGKLYITSNDPLSTLKEIPII